jgi:hypothetical protein
LLQQARSYDGAVVSSAGRASNGSAAAVAGGRRRGCGVRHGGQAALRRRRVTDDDIDAFWNERRVENAGETRMLAKIGYLNRITVLN